MPERNGFTRNRSVGNIDASANGVAYPKLSFTVDNPVAPPSLIGAQLVVSAEDSTSLERAAQSAANWIVIDWADCASRQATDETRNRTLAAISRLARGTKRKAVRLNRLDAPGAYRDLLEFISRVGEHLDAIVVPDVKHAADIYPLEALLLQAEQTGVLPRRLTIEAHLDPTALSSADRIRSIMEASPYLEALVVDLAYVLASEAGDGNDESGLSTPPAARFHERLDNLLTASRRCGVSLVAETRNGASGGGGTLWRTSRLAMALGFRGMQCRTEEHVHIVNQVFTPPYDGESWPVRRLEEYALATAGRSNVIPSRHGEGGGITFLPWSDD